MKPAYYIIFFIIILLLLRRRKKKAWLQQYIKSKKTEDNTEMFELAKRFMDKECLIYTFDSQITGTIREVTEGAIMLESDNTLEAVNLDFIVRIREYPRKKNGKKKVIAD